MKLLKFSGLKLNEYLDIEIDFKDNLSILTGTNGSGKTTSLNLIQAILLPNLLDFFITPFEFISLEFLHKEKIFTITVIKNKQEITFRILDNENKIKEEELIISRSLINEFDYYKSNKNDIKHNEIFLKKFQDHPYILFINQITKPIFIGLERTNNDIREDYKDYLYERNLFLRKDLKNFNSFSHKENLGVSILETEMLVQSIYKRLKSIQDIYFKSIQKELISSSFNFIDFDMNDLPSELNLKEKYIILEKQSEIEESLKKIGFLDADLSSKLKLFFEKIKVLFEENNRNEDRGLTIEWLLNKSQIDKLFNILKIIDEYNIRADKTFEPINKFLGIINSFFKDTQKKLFIDEVGRLFVSKPSGRNLTVDELSSGERQLVILFANVIFNKYKNKKYSSEILIIDEPEISLHIRWQEKFIDSLFEASSNTQFIIATHSPDIIGDYKFNSVRMQKKVI
jgi:predicted ATP-binding protein involved in virulence